VRGRLESDIPTTILIIDARLFSIRDFEQGKERSGWSGAQVVNPVRTVSAVVSLYAAFLIGSGGERPRGDVPVTLA